MDNDGKFIKLKFVNAKHFVLRCRLKQPWLPTDQSLAFGVTVGDVPFGSDGVVNSLLLHTEAIWFQKCLFVSFGKSYAPLRSQAPALAGLRASAIAPALHDSIPCAAKIRKDERRPHARHWLALARLAEISPDS